MENSQAQGENNPQAQENVIPTLGAMLGGDMATPEQIQNQGTPELDAAGFPVAPNTKPEEKAEGAEGDKPAGTPDATVSPIEEAYSFLAGDGSNLSQEDLTTRNQLFGNFGASAMNPTGDLVDNTGKVVLTRAALDAFIESGEVPTDENGNQIQADGTIIKSAEDIQPRFIDATRELFEAEIPMQLLDAEGKPKVYADSAEGVAEYAKDVYRQGEVNAVTQFLNSNPKVKDFFFHVANGNTPETYQLAPVDYSKLDVNVLDKAEKLNLIKTSLEKQKVMNAGSLMKTFELAGDDVINSTAADAVITLNNLTAKEKADAEASYLAKQEEEKQSNIKYWNELKSVVDKGSLKNIKIPDTEKESFFKYLAMPIDSKGISQAQLDMDNEDLETSLMIDYLRYKKGNIDDLINLRAKTSKVDAIRQRMKAVPNPKIVSTNKPTPTNQNQAPDINLGMLLNAEQR